MNRFLLLGLLLYGLLFTGLLARNPALLALMAPLLVYLGLGLFFGPDRIRLKVERTVSSDRVSQGTPVTVTLTATNEGGRLEEVHLQDVTPGSLEPEDGAAGLITSLEPGETVTWQYTLRAGRGYYWLYGVEVRAGDHAGLFNQEKSLEVRTRFMVLPQTSKQKRLAIRPRRTRVYSGFIPARLGGPGVDFFGVREYERGDPLRLVNWKATARHPQAFFTNEFEQERVADVGLILDARHRCYPRSQRDSLFEHAVSATAALAESFLNDGNRVGLFIYGRVAEWTLPGYGKIQRERILKALARAKPGSSLVFDNLNYLPTRLFPAHSQLIFISPLLKDDRQTLLWLRARGYQVLVISPDPVGFEEKYLEPHPDLTTGKRIVTLERELMFRQLRQAGVQVITWDIDRPFFQVVNSFLRRHPFLRQ